MDFYKAAGLESRNDRIIKAILEKEKAVCPGSVALIGIYGSFQTGDIHPLSDLDLLILINDERGWQLGTVFIQDDLGMIFTAQAGKASGRTPVIPILISPN